VSDDGVNDGAILMLALGQDEAAEVFKHLEPKEVQKLGQAMANIKNLSRTAIDVVLSKFQVETSSDANVNLDSNDYVRGVLTKALGDEKAGPLLDRILQQGSQRGIENLKWMEAPAVADLIKNEHPQIIASILVHLDREHASGVIKSLEEKLRNDVMLRVATLDGVQPDALQELNEVMSKALSGGDRKRNTALDGVKVAGELLNLLGGGIDAPIIEALKAHDAELAQKIEDQMFIFENLVDIDNKGIQVLLREVQSESLILALKGTSEELRGKIFSNMSQRAAEMLKEDLESKGPVRVSEVETAQKEIIKTARRLADEGQIMLGGKGDEGLI
jgi:flagellar motor switch protein FliG